MADEVILLEFKIDDSQSSTTLNSLNTQLAKMKTELMNTEIGSEKFKKLSKEISAVETKALNAAAAMKGMGKEELFGKIGQLAGGVSAAFAGMFLILGNNNKAIVELQKNLNMAVGVVMAVKGGMEAMSAATQLAKAAQIALNTAMMANPIGLIITAVAALAAGLIYFATQSNEAAVAQYNFNEALKKTDALTSKLTDSMAQFIHERKIAGASELELLQLEIDGIKEKQAIEYATAKQQQKNWKNLTDDQKEEWKKRIKLVGDANKEITNLERKKEEIIANQAKQANQLKLQNMADGVAKEKALLTAKYLDDLNQAYGNAELISQLKIAYTKNLSEIDKKYSEQKAELNAKEIEKEKARQAELLKSNEEQLQRERDQTVLLLGIEDKKAHELLAIDKFYADNALTIEEQKNALLKLENDTYAEMQRDADIAGYMLTESQKLTHEQKLKDITLQYEQEKTRILQEEEAKRQQFQADTIQKTTDALLSSIQTIMKLDQIHTDQKISEIQATYDKQIEKNQKLLDNNIITQEQFNSRKEAIDAKYEKKINAEKHKSFEKQKAASLIEATIKGVVAMLELVSQAGIAGIIIGGALIAGEIALISAQKNPYAKGGILNGPSHAQGGIATPFGELEGGEAVINKKSTSMFLPQLSAINQAGGGKAFSNTNSMNSVASIEENSLRAIVSEVVSQVVSIPVINVATETERINVRQRTIQNKALI